MAKILKISLLTLCLFLSTGMLLAQDPPPKGKVIVSGKITDQFSGSGLGGVQVELVKNGSVVETKMTSSNGKYSFSKQEMGVVYTIRYSKTGYVSKYMELDTKIPEDNSFGDRPLDLSPTLFENVPDVDFSFLNNKPVAKGKYNKSTDEFEFDIGYIQGVKKEIEKVLKEVEKKKLDAENAKAAEEKKYTDALTAAENAMKSGDYTTAKAKYQEAAQAKPSEKANLDQKIAFAEKKEKEKFQAQETEKNYTSALTDAQKAMASKDYGAAKAAYEKALAAKPNDKTAQDGLKNATDQIIKFQEDETKFQTFINNGEKALLDEKWDDAFKAFEEAKKMRPTDNAVIQGLEKAKKGKFAADEAAKKEAENQKKFTDFVAAGDKEFTAKNYDKAIKAYEDALAIKDDAGVKKKKFDAEEGKKAAEKDAAAKAELEKKKQEYAQFIKEGNDALAAKDYDKALGSYKSALDTKVNDAEANAKITAAQTAKANAAKELEAKENFNKTIQAGDTKLAAKEFDNAIAEYKKALAMKIDDPAANAKIKEATDAKTAYDKELAEKAANEKAEKLKKDFEAAIAAGDTKLGNKEWDAATAEFNKALALKFDDATAKAKLKEVTDAKTAYEKELAEKAANEKAEKLKKDFEAAIAAGDTKLGNKEWDAATAEYNKALALKFDDATAKAKLKEVIDTKTAYEKELAEKAANEKAEKQKKDFEAAIAAGDTKLGNKEWDAATAEYNKALALKFDDATAKAKLKEVTDTKTAYEKELAEKAANEKAEKLKKDFEAAIAAGDTKLGNKEWDAATAEYNKALALKFDDATAKAKLKEVTDAKTAYEKELAEKSANEKAEKLKKDFEAAIAAGDAKLGNKEWDAATAEYNKALALKFDDATAKAKLKEVTDAKTAYEKELAEKSAAEKAEKLKKDFEAAITAGDTKLGNKEWDAATAEYNKALATKFDDATAKAKLKEVIDTKIAYEKELAEKSATELAEKKRKNFEADIAAGDAKLANKEWDAATAEYKKALALKYDDATANAKIKDVATAKAEYDKEQAALNAEKKKAEFDKWITEGDGLLASNDFDKAIADYTKALALKVDDAAANAKIAGAKAAKDEFNKNQANAAANKKLFEEAVKAADKEFDAGEFKAAIALYDKALTYNRDDKHSKDRIGLANERLANRDKELKEQFEKILSQADKDFDAGNYADAKGYYERYLKKYPDHDHSKNRIAEANEKIKAMGAAEADYQKYMASGNKFLTEKKWDEAIASYESALGVKANDKSATDKKNEAARLKQKAIDDLVNADKAKTEAAYQGFITKANASFDAGEFEASIKSYNDALGVRANDNFATKRIEEANTRIRERKEKLEGEMAKILSQADKDFDAANYEDAKNYYNRYLKFKPDNDHSKNRLKEIDKLIAEANAAKMDKAAKEKAYKEWMGKGAASLSAKKYDEAIANYEGALGIIPNDPAATQKIEEIKKIKEDLFNLAKQQANQKNQNAKYAEAMAKAQAESDAGNFNEAIGFYQDALRIKENDRPAAEGIALCKKRLKEKQAFIDEQYRKAIEIADGFFNSKNYKDAIPVYQQALRYKKNEPYPQDQIDKANQALNNNKPNSNGDKFKAYDGGTLVTNQSIEDAIRMIEEAKRQDKYQKELDYVAIQDRNSAITKDYKDEQSTTIFENNAQNIKTHDALDNLKVNDKYRVENANENISVLDGRSAWYTGRSDNDTQDGYNDQQNYNQAQFERGELFKGSDRYRLEKVDSVAEFLDVRDEAYRGAMKDQTNTNYNKQLSYDEQRFVRERQFEYMDSYRVYNVDSVRHYKDVRDENYRNTIHDQSNANYKKQENNNELAFNRSRQFENMDSYRVYNVDSVKHYKDVRDENYRNTIHDQSNANYKKQENNNELAYNRSRQFENMDSYRVYNADSVKHYKDVRDENYRNTIHDQSNANYKKQENNNELAYNRSRQFENMDSYRVYNVDSVKYYKDLRDEKYRETLHSESSKIYNTQDKNNETAFARSQMFNDKDELRKESVDETNKVIDEKVTFNANMNEKGREVTQHNNETLIDRNVQYDNFNREKSGNYINQSKEFIDKADVNTANATGFKDKGEENRKENVEKAKNTLPTEPKKYDTGYLAQLTKEYPEGVNQWTVNKTNENGVVTEVTIRRIVVKGGTANDYKMVINRWGTYYTKNGQTSNEYTWNVETSGNIKEYTE